MASTALRTSGHCLRWCTRREPRRARARRGRRDTRRLSPASNVVEGTLEPPGPADLVPLPERGEDGEARDAGVEALRAGEVATVVLNGGMATRFGGVVKGTVEAFDGRSFLELKLSSTAEVGAALEEAAAVEH